MRKILNILGICTLVLGISATAYAADSIMRISLQLPSKSLLGQNLVLFQSKVEAESGGSIEVEIYCSAKLCKDKEVPAAVGYGAIKAGVASLMRYVGDIPAVDIFYQPFLMDSEEKIRKAVVKGSPIRGTIDEAIKATGSTVLSWQAYGGATMLSKGGPISNPSDMKGKKVKDLAKRWASL